VRKYKSQGAKVKIKLTQSTLIYILKKYFLDAHCVSETDQYTDGGPEIKTTVGTCSRLPWRNM
jgi:hypothetical protein